jgi:tetratricopeptide (TPR) repeat protein
MLEIEPLVRFRLFIILLIPTLYSAQIFPEENVHNLLSEGIDNIITQDYQKARLNFEKLDLEYKNLPLGKIFLAAVNIAETIDYGKEFDDETINNLLEEAESISDSLLTNDDEDLWNNYFMALATGYLAYYKTIKESYISTITNGIISLEHFRKCLEIDSLFYDSYIAFGTYAYWKSLNSESLDWIPFLSDERSEGIKLLYTAINNFSYNRYLGINSLIWIYIDMNDYQKAINLAEKVIEQYPETRYFRWGLSRAYEDVDPTRAIEEYSNILNSILNIDENNHYNEIILKHKIAMLYDKLEKYDSALKYCNEIKTLSDLSDRVKEKLRDRFIRVEKLKNKCLIKLRGNKF